jgi:hypothetical protein
MGFFDDLLDKAKDAKGRKERAMKSFDDYLATFAEKERIVSGALDVGRLRVLVRHAMDDVVSSEDDDRSIADDLSVLSHDHIMAHLHRTKQVLDHAEVQHEYMRKLLEHLFIFLQREEYVLRKLESGSMSAAEGHSMLNQILSQERDVVGKLNAVPENIDIFVKFVQGVHSLDQLDSRGKRAFELVKPFFDKAVPGVRQGNVGGEITQRWIQEVLEGMTYGMYEALDKGLMMEHEDALSEFVNRPMFRDFVKRVILSLGKKRVSDRMIDAFVFAFRDVYNWQG